MFINIKIAHLCNGSEHYEFILNVEDLNFVKVDCQIVNGIFLQGEDPNLISLDFKTHWFSGLHHGFKTEELCSFLENNNQNKIFYINLTGEMKEK